MKPIKSFQIITHGLEYSQFFQGHGIALTSWEDCATGIGDSPQDALDDALEQLAQGDWDVDALEKSADWRAYLASVATPEEWREDCTAFAKRTPVNADWNEDLHFFLSVDVKGGA